METLMLLILIVVVALGVCGLTIARDNKLKQDREETRSRLADLINKSIK